jgi:rhodanese-related sulfurtransferase
MFGRTLFRTIAASANVLTLAACGGTEETRSSTEEAQVESGERASATYADISVEQLRTMMADQDPFLVNVHIPFEGDLPETDASIRFDEISQHLDQLPQDKDANIILYSRSGRMSAEAAGVLAELGYTNVSNLEGDSAPGRPQGTRFSGDPPTLQPPVRKREIRPPATKRIAT